METKKKVIIDRSKWRFGGDSETNFQSPQGEVLDLNFLLGNTELKNEQNFMCCLGFACNQLLGVPDNELEGVATPCEINEEYLTNDTLFTYEVEDLKLDSKFVNMAIRLNDEDVFTHSEREEKLIELFAEQGVELVFEGEYKLEEYCLDQCWHHFGEDSYADFETTPTG